MDTRTREGFWFGLGAYVLWGLVPLYFRAIIPPVPAWEAVMHRVVWTVALLALLITVLRRWTHLKLAVVHGPTRLCLLVSAVLIAVNWFVYIYSVVTEQIRQASLGYYLTPLVSILLGLVILGERLRPLQWCAVALAAVGVALLVALMGAFPLVSLSLALSFSFYSLVRKRTPVDAVTGLFFESALLMPLALGLMVWWRLEDQLIFGTRSLALDAALMASGFVTAGPLLCFGQAARRLPLSTLGFLQYISPTIQLLLAVFLYGEAMTAAQWASYAVIWVALVVFSMDSVRKMQAERRKLEGSGV